MSVLRIYTLFLLVLFLLKPSNAYADFWGGDLPLLTQIVANTLQELTKLQTIIGKGQETIDLIQDINRGIRDAMDIIRTQNTTLSPGILSDLQSLQEIMTVVENLYGRVPKTREAKTQETTDTSVAESIHLHNEAFRYADRVDPEAERIKAYARDVNPLGAGKLSAQALGVLIHIMNQILRVNAAMLKIQTEQLALQNRSSKLNSQQFRVQYDTLSHAFKHYQPNFRLSPLSPN